MDTSMELQSSSAHDLRVVRKLLWDVICDLIKPAERDEVKRALGQSIIAENEGLFAEATAFADILGDVQLTTKSLLARQQLCNNPQRRMVEAEIGILLDRLRGVATAAAFSGSAVKERDPESVLPKAGPKDKAVYDYLVTSGTGTSQSSSNGRSRSALVRPGTASSRPTTASSMSRPSTASSGSGSQTYDATSIVATMQDKLNVYEIDAVKEVLRNALQEERQALMEDVEYMTSLLDEETDVQTKAAAAPPSLAELKEYSSKLQEVVVAEEARLEHEQRVSSMFAAAENEASKAGRLRRMVGASRSPEQPAPNVLTITHPPAESTATPPDTLTASASTLSKQSSQQAVSRSEVPGSTQSRTSSAAACAPLPPRPAPGVSATAAASAPVLKPPTPPAASDRPSSGASTSSSKLGNSRPSSRESAPVSKPPLGLPSSGVGPSELRPSTDMLAPLPSPLLLRSPSSIQRAGEGILSGAPRLAPLRAAGSDSDPCTSSPKAALFSTDGGASASAHRAASPIWERNNSGRAKYSSPAQLRALVGHDLGDLATRSPSKVGAAAGQGAGGPPFPLSVTQLPNQSEPRPALLASGPQGQGSSSTSSHGSKVVRDVGTLLDAEAGAAIGGLAAILAKHNYSNKAQVASSSPRAQPAPGT